MLRFLPKSRSYCKIVIKNAQSQFPRNERSEKLDFQQLNHESKVPTQPVAHSFPDSPNSEVVIDSKTIQLLERLSLVDLDDKEALATLKSSIQFADKIAHIDTNDVEPLYTVLEAQSLHLRADTVTEGNCREDVLHNAKVSDEDYFVSPPGNIPLQQADKTFTDDDKRKRN